LKERNVIILFIIVFLVVLSPFLLNFTISGIDFVQFRFISTPEQVLTRYYTDRDVAEDQTLDPLILGGSRMVPLLEKEILKKEIVKRRYGTIIALGHIGNKNSIPVLEQILQDREEKEAFREGSLIAIALIDLPTARKIAPQYLSEAGRVSQIAKEVLTQNPYLGKRSYWDAFFRVHD